MEIFRNSFDRATFVVVCYQAINEIIFVNFISAEAFEMIVAPVGKLNCMATIYIHKNFMLKLLNIKAISTNLMIELVSMIRA